MSTSKNEEIYKLFNKLENLDKIDLEDYYKGRKEIFDEEDREKFKITRDIMTDLLDDYGWKLVHHIKTPYKHDITEHECVSKRETDGTYFEYGYTSTYNNGIDWSYLGDAVEVFPMLKVKTVYE